jgi:hypothetical protein
VVTRLYEGIDALQLAARAMAENLLPVIERLDGGGPLAQVGTAFVFRHDNHTVIVTADHVVCGPTQKFVQLGPGETIRWPPRVRAPSCVRDIINSATNCTTFWAALFLLTPTRALASILGRTSLRITIGRR